MARNDYIMSLAAANAHMTRYYCKEMQDIMSVSYLPLFKISYSFWSKDFHLSSLQSTACKSLFFLCLSIVYFFMYYLFIVILFYSLLLLLLSSLLLYGLFLKICICLLYMYFYMKFNIPLNTLHIKFYMLCSFKLKHSLVHVFLFRP